MNSSKLTTRTPCSVFFILQACTRRLSSCASPSAACHSAIYRQRCPWVTRGGCPSFVRPVQATAVSRAAARRQLSQSCAKPDEDEIQDNINTRGSPVLEIMPAENPKLGFVGAGMMASAMINGIVAAKATQADCITASDLYNKQGLDRLSASGVRTTACNAEVAAGSRVIFLAVKPDVIPTVLREICDQVAEDTLLVSIAQGVTISALEELAPGKRVVRVMPNTPCLVSEMAAAFCMGSLATDEDKKLLEGLLGSVGYAIEVPESKLDAVTGLSGSGPAYVFMMIEALADGGVRMGLPRATALQLAAQTVKGAATMVLETGTHPAILKDQVCSPGGTTIAAVEALEKGGFRAATMSAVIAASNKSIEMRGEKK